MRDFIEIFEVGWIAMILPKKVPIHHYNLRRFFSQQSGKFIMPYGKNSIVNEELPQPNSNILEEKSNQIICDRK
jgi:hypothetical protein